MGPVPGNPDTEDQVASLFAAGQSRPWHEILAAEVTATLPSSTSIDGPRIGEATLGHHYNAVSDYFLWKNRLNCRG